MPRNISDAMASQGHYWFRLVAVEIIVGKRNNESVSVIAFELAPTTDKDVFKGLELTGRVFKLDGETNKNDVGLSTSGRASLYEGRLEVLLYGTEAEMSVIQSGYFHSPRSHGILRITTDKKLHSTIIQAGDGNLGIMEWSITFHTQYLNKVSSAD